MSAVERAVLGILGKVPSNFLQLPGSFWLAPLAEIQQPTEKAGAPLLMEALVGRPPFPLSGSTPCRKANSTAGRMIGLIQIQA